MVETTSAYISEQATLPTARQNLARIRRRLNIGASLPLASKQSVVLDIYHAAFKLSQDLRFSYIFQNPKSALRET
jgi:hypothetical protein